MLRSIAAVNFVRRTSLHGLPGLRTVIVPMLRLVCPMLAVFRPGLAAVVLLVNVSVMPVGIAVAVLPAMVGVGKHCRSHY
jgi:hypothetical protein